MKDIKDIYKALLYSILCGVIALSIGYISARMDILIIFLTFALILSFVLTKHYELPMALLFNGLFVYFYVVYKAGFNTNSLLTGGFYGMLAFTSIVGGMKYFKEIRVTMVDILMTVYFVLYYLSFLMFSSDNPGSIQKMTLFPLLVITPYYSMRLLSKTENIRRFFVFVIIVTALLIVPSLLELIFNPIHAHSSRFSLYKRITMWDQATNEFLQNPVTGVGMGNSVGGSGFPHNIILEILAEFGIIGFVFLVLLLNIVIRHAFIVSKGINKNALYMRIALVLFIYNSIEGLFSGFLGNQTTIYMGIGMIESLYVINKGRNE